MPESAGRILRGQTSQTTFHRTDTVTLRSSGRWCLCRPRVDRVGLSNRSARRNLLFTCRYAISLSSLIQRPVKTKSGVATPPSRNSNPLLRSTSAFGAVRLVRISILPRRDDTFLAVKMLHRHMLPQMEQIFQRIDSKDCWAGINPRIQACSTASIGISATILQEVAVWISQEHLEHPSIPAIRLGSSSVPQR